jgi:hypothetical protein
MDPRAQVHSGRDRRRAIATRGQSAIQTPSLCLIGVSLHRARSLLNGKTRPWPERKRYRVGPNVLSWPKILTVNP